MKPELVIALDVPSREEALRLAGDIIPVTPWLKVGLELFTRAGPDVLFALKKMGGKIFLDLKLHDIPHTVGRAVEAAIEAGADMCDVHMSGGESMCRAAVEAAKEARRRGRACLLLGVTILTSVAPEELPTDVRTLAAEYACKAMDWGLDGVVCSGREAADVKQATRNRILCLCPGIRPGAFEDKFALHDDQRRVFTPQEAARAGADFLVVGRPVLRADVPALAAREIIDSYK